MKSFTDFLRSRIGKNKFVWGKGDLEHDKKQPKETKADRALKFMWRSGDLEHHDIKEEITEKFELPKDHKGNFANPHQISHSAYSSAHPHNKTDEPVVGSHSHDEFLAHHENLSSDEEEAVRDYKGSGHRETNEYLRNAHKKFKAERNKHFKGMKTGIKYKEDDHKDLKKQHHNIAHHQSHDEDDDPSDDDWQEHHIEDHVHHLDKVTNHRTVEHHTVYRGGFKGDKTKFPIGHEYTDHGYASTSFHRSTAKSFAKEHKVGKDSEGWDKYKSHIHVIHVPKGSRGHYLDVQGDDSNHSNSEEKEFLLHRGTRFKVTHHSEDGSHHYIHSRVVKQGIRHKYKFEKKQGHPDKPKDDHGLPGQQKFPFMKHHKRFK
jgi:hypothetical protein